MSSQFDPLFKSVFLALSGQGCAAFAATNLLLLGQQIAAAHRQSVAADADSASLLSCFHH
jgi:hypothetical protein